MKSLKLTALLLAIFFASNITAQMSDECRVNLSLFTEYAKVKNYADAYEPWMKVYTECPSASKNIYSLGVRILEWKIKQATTQEEFNAAIAAGATEIAVTSWHIFSPPASVYVAGRRRVSK